MSGKSAQQRARIMVEVDCYLGDLLRRNCFGHWINSLGQALLFPVLPVVLDCNNKYCIFCSAVKYRFCLSDDKLSRDALTAYAIDRSNIREFQ